MPGHVSKKGLDLAPEGRRRSGCILFPLFPVQLHDLPRYSVILEMQADVPESVRAVVAP